MDVIVFLLLVLHRWLAGVQNGAGYGKYLSNRRHAAWVLIGMAGVAALWLILHHPPAFFISFGMAGAVTSGLAAWMIELSFDHKLPKKYADIHFHEMFKTGGIVILTACAGANLIMIICSVYPGLILHKGMVNVFSGHSFFYPGTDDETGRTFRIPLLNITVPRLSTGWRIALAVAGISVVFLSNRFDWSLTLWK